jgi:hypothetical protein
MKREIPLIAILSKPLPEDRAVNLTGGEVDINIDSYKNSLLPLCTGAWPVSTSDIDGGSVIPTLINIADNAGDVTLRRNHLNTTGSSAEPIPGRAPFFLTFQRVEVAM